MVWPTVGSRTAEEQKNRTVVVYRRVHCVTCKRAQPYNYPSEMVEIPGVRRRLGLDSVPDAAAAERASEGCVAALV